MVYFGPDEKSFGRTGHLNVKLAAQRIGAMLSATAMRGGDTVFQANGIRHRMIRRRNHAGLTGGLCDLARDRSRKICHLVHALPGGVGEFAAAYPRGCGCDRAQQKMLAQHFSHGHPRKDHQLLIVIIDIF
jgi:hypothetical protein